MTQAEKLEALVLKAIERGLVTEAVISEDPIGYMYKAVFDA